MLSLLEDISTLGSLFDVSSSIIGDKLNELLKAANFNEFLDGDDFNEFLDGDDFNGLKTISCWLGLANDRYDCELFDSPDPFITLVALVAFITLVALVALGTLGTLVAFNFILINESIFYNDYRIYL